MAPTEIGLIGTDTQMQAARTSQRSVARFNEDDCYATARGLVGDHLLQLGEAPIVDAVGFPILPNPVEVFEDDPLVVRFRVSNDLLADAMVGVRDKTSLPARDTPERAFGALAAVGLKRSSGSFEASFLVANLLRRVGLFVGGHGDALDAGDQRPGCRMAQESPAPEP